MNKVDELAYRYAITQLEEENRLLREEAKRLRIAMKNYLNS